MPKNARFESVRFARYIEASSINSSVKERSSERCIMSSSPRLRGLGASQGPLVCSTIALVKLEVVFSHGILHFRPVPVRDGPAPNGALWEMRPPVLDGCTIYHIFWVAGTTQINWFIKYLFATQNLWFRTTLFEWCDHLTFPEYNSM
jgi:hypothetical protein